MWTRYLRNAILTGVFLLPLVPLIVANNLFFPFITGKNFFFRITVEILFALWILLALRDPRFRLKRSWIAISGGVFLVAVTLADILGENFFKSFWSNFERMEGLLTLLHLGAYFVVTATVLKTEKLWGWFWNTTLAVSATVSLYAILQLAGAFEIHQGGDRLDATLGNATYLAVYNLFHVFLALLMAVRSPRMGSRILYSLLAALNAFILIYTATRGAILGLVGGLFLATILIAIFERAQPLLRKTALGFLAFLVVVSGLFFLVHDTTYVRQHNVLSRVANISLSEGSTRFAIWGIALQGVKEKPLLGWGQENFNIVFNKYYDAKLYTQEPWFDHVHNIVFDWLIAGGLLTALAYFAIPLSVLWYLWRPQSRLVFSVSERSILTGLLAGYFFHNLFVFDNIVSYFLYVSILAYVYARVQASLEVVKNVKEITRPWTIPLSAERIVGAMIVVLLAGSLYVFNGRGIATSSALIEALQRAQQPAQDPQAMLDAFTRAGSYNVVGSQEVAEQTVFAAVSLAGRSDVPQEIQQRMFALAKNSMEEELAHGADDARVRLFFASLLSRYGQFTSALSEIKRAQELSPEKPAIAFELGNVYIAQGNMPAAVATFKGVYEDLPEYTDAKIFYAVSAIYAQDLELAERILKTNEPAGMALLRDDDRLLNAVVAIKRFDIAKTIWEMRIARSPSNASAHLSLAGAYLELGESVLAIDHIKTAMALDPKFKAQGEAIIRDILGGTTTTN